MRRARVRGALVALAIAVIAGCGSDIVQYVPSPSADTQAAAQTVARDSLQQLLAGATAPPFVLDWTSVEAGVTLSNQKSDAFCRALDTPGVDEVLKSLLAAGLDALSLKLRKKPLPDEAEGLLAIAAKFAVKTCPRWVPRPVPTTASVATPVPIEVPAWYPSDYSPVAGDPNVAWQWVDHQTFTCVRPVVGCWRIRVLAQFGCPQSLKVTIAIRDAFETVLEYLTAATPPVPPRQTIETAFGTLRANSIDAQAVFVTCT
jgi:hypothetical protein